MGEFKFIVNICYWSLLIKDYTLASYKKGVEYLIHDIAKHHLVNKYGYPEDIASLVYDPKFPIRGEQGSVEGSKVVHWRSEMRSGTHDVAVA